MRIGVLALQGGFAEHVDMLRKLDVECVEIRNKADLQIELDGLIFPGGESTVIGRLLHQMDLFTSLKRMIEEGMPVFGTCAGMILLAGAIDNVPAAWLGCMPITVQRNGFGRQLGSFQTTGTFSGIGDIPMTFIRAPFISSASPDVRILADVRGFKVAAETDSMLVTSFHPELTSDVSVHRYFIEKVRSAKVVFRSGSTELMEA